MVRQRRGLRSRQVNSVKQHGDGYEHILRDFEEHLKALEYLARALDLSMIESKYSAVVRSCESLEHIKRDSQKFLWLLKNTQVLLLYLHAAVNSMDVVLQSIKGCLLDHSKAASIVSSLCSSISHCMELVHDQDRQAQEALHLHLTESGLVPALSRFTTVTWQAVQQLGTSDDQQQPQLQRQRQWQREQQHDDGPRQRTASTLVAELLALWHAILLHALAGPRPDMSFGTALPALIELTSDFYSLLKNVKASIDSRSSSSSTLLSTCNVALDSAASTSLALAEYIVWLDSSEPQQAQYIYTTERLPELLLQLLAYQVGQLHTACGGVSQALQDRHTATADQTEQQEQQQQQPPFAGCVVPTSHLTVLQILHLESPSDSAGVEAQNIQDLVLQYTMTLHAVCRAVLPRCSAEDQLSSSSSSSESNCSTHDAGQQHLENTYTTYVHEVPGHVLVPIVKMLIEVVLLTPPDMSLAVHAFSLNVVNLLLNIAATPVPTATAAAAVHQQDPEESASCPWPQLPAAVAAGLLRPVVAQLPQAVMYCLLQSDQQQQQRESDRLMLLHSYGSLLIAVCQSVESKHIAAVLKSQSPRDLFVTLAAVEAVIRAQACHLAPQWWTEERQQHQADPYENASSSGSTTTTSCPIRDILQHPQDQAAMLLLPFALKVAEALLELMQQPRQQQHWLTPSDSARSTSLLCVRLFTLMITVLTICQAAVAGVGCCGAATQPTADITQHPRVGDVLSTASDVSYAVGSVAYHWWRAVDEGTSSAARNVLPAVLLFRAVTIWSCDVCQRLQIMPPQHLSGAANAISLASLSAGLLDSVIHVIDVLQPLVAAEAYPVEPATSSAAAHEGVATAAEPVITHQLRPGGNDNFKLLYRCLAGLLQQSRDLSRCSGGRVNTWSSGDDARTLKMCRKGHGFESERARSLSSFSVFAGTLDR